jgi:hypothetical protein
VIPRPLQSAALAAAILALAGRASAQVPFDVGGAGPSSAPPAPPADTVVAVDDDRHQHIDRTWLYLDDARIPDPLKVIGTFQASYTNVGSPTRIGGGNALAGQSTYNSFALNTAQPGGMIGIGGEIGLFSHVSIMTIVDLTAGGQGPSPSAGLVAGVRVQALPSRFRDSHLVISAGYLREAWQGPVYDDDNNTWAPGKPYGDSGAWAQVAFVQEISRVRFGATVHVEHVFADGRDPLDVMVQAGASCRIVAGFRLGVEYVGQDLEEAVDPGAEGGARHFMGPVASLQLLRDRLSLVAGPSFGMSARSPEVLGRAGAAFGF